MKNTNKKTRRITQKGFTLVELLIVIGVLVIVVAATFTTQGGLFADTYLDTNTEQLVQNLRLAQMRSITRLDDAKWGVYFDEDVGGTDDMFVLFQGTSYASRDSSYDIVTELPNIISLSNISLNGGGNDVVFDKLTGETSNDGSLQISDNLGHSYTISLNSKGVIDVN